MDGILLIVTLYLNAVSSCHAVGATEQRIEGADYQIVEYSCGEKHHFIWQGKCKSMDIYGMPFKIVDDTGRGFYLNRFGELQAASLQVMPEDAHESYCGGG